jgi:hypothetical protein
MPCGQRAFSNFLALLEFLSRMKNLIGGKPSPGTRFIAVIGSASFSEI